MTSALIPIQEVDPLQRIAQLVEDAMNGARSKRAYGDALQVFLRWCQTERAALNKASVQNYRSVLQARGLAPATVNQHLSAIRKLAAEAADNGLVESNIAQGIARVQGVKMQGVRHGNWLTRDQAQALLNAPTIGTLKGSRDRAILAIMLGAGLRRSEVAALTFAHIQQRDGRWVIVDLVGKGTRVRSVPIPAWTKTSIDAWAAAAQIAEGHVFRPMHKGGWMIGEHMTAQAVRDVVKEYSNALHLGIAAHDLRRTFAKLAHKGGAGLDQIQLSLGHARIETTERYLNVKQDLTDAPCDHLGLRVEGED